MQEFTAYWKNYVNFSDRTNLRGYWIPVLIFAVINGVLALLGRTGDGGQNIFTVLASLLSLATLIPGLAITVRRLRDAGRTWTWIFISLVPLVGWIWEIVLLCKPSM